MRAGYEANRQQLVAEFEGVIRSLRISELTSRDLCDLLRVLYMVIRRRRGSAAAEEIANSARSAAEAPRLRLV